MKQSRFPTFVLITTPISTNLRHYLQHTIHGAVIFDNSPFVRDYASLSLLHDTSGRIHISSMLPPLTFLLVTRNLILLSEKTHPLTHKLRATMATYVFGSCTRITARLKHMNTNEAK
jgi:hypothetical protein